MKKPFVRLLLIWLCVLALLCVFDVTVLKNIRVEVADGMEVAPFRLLATPILLAESVPEEGSYPDLVQRLGPATEGVHFLSTRRKMGFYDLQWGGSAHFRFNSEDNTYSGFTVAHTRLGTGRWLILPGIMLAVAIAEVVVYKHRKKKKGKAINKPESPEPQPVDTPQQA
jgi:hypothetical protein